MHPILYTLNTLTQGKLSLMARPLGTEYLEDYLTELKLLDVHTVVSLLETQEQYALGLSQEGAVCQQLGLGYLHLPIPDRGLASTAKALNLARQIQSLLAANQHIAVHCRAGIGRTSLIIGAVLILEGLTAQAALEQMSRTRGVEVPDTEEQAEWLRQLPQEIKYRNLK